MSESVSFKKMIITVAGKDIELTLTEAKELRDILNSTLGSPSSAPVVIDRTVYRDRWPWQYWTMSNATTDSTLFISAKSGDVSL